MNEWTGGTPTGKSEWMGVSPGPANIKECDIEACNRERATEMVEGLKGQEDVSAVESNVHGTLVLNRMQDANLSILVRVPRCILAC